MLRLGFGGLGLGFEVWGLEARGWGLRLVVLGFVDVGFGVFSGVEIWSLEFGVQCRVLSARGLGFYLTQCIY